MLALKHKLKRIDSGMSKDDFGIFLAENVQAKYKGGPKTAGMVDSGGNIKPLYLWEYHLWRDVQVFKASAYVVRPEHVEEIIGTLCMIGKDYPVKPAPFAAFLALMHALGLRAERVILYGDDDPQRQCVHWSKVTPGNVVPGAIITALQTDKCWFVYPNNIRAVNRLLSKKERSNA